MAPQDDDWLRHPLRHVRHRESGGASRSLRPPHSQTLISIVTVVSLIKVSEKFWLVRLGRDGIYLPNTQVLWATLSGMFCAFNATNLIWQVLIDDGKATPRHKIVTEGLRWLPM